MKLFCENIEWFSTFNYFRKRISIADICQDSSYFYASDDGLQ